MTETSRQKTFKKQTSRDPTSTGEATTSEEMSRPRTQAERTAEARQKLIEAAVRLIARQGYSRTSVAQIGAEAGYAASLIRHHFGSKEGLLRAISDLVLGRFYERQSELAAGNRRGIDAMAAILDRYLDEMKARPDTSRALQVLIGEALGPVPEIREVFAEHTESYRRSVQEVLERGIAEGLIRSDLDPAAEAVAFVATLRGLVGQWMASPNSFDLEAVQNLAEAGPARSSRSKRAKRLASEPGRGTPISLNGNQGGVGEAQHRRSRRAPRRAGRARPLGHLLEPRALASAIAMRSV